jgi:predicted transcriptional regulator
MSVLERERRLLKVRKCTRYSLLCYMLRLCRKPKSMAEIYWGRPSAFTYGLLKELTSLALECDFVERRNGKFLTTSKGKEFIKRFGSLLELFES